MLTAVDDKKIWQRILMRAAMNLPLFDNEVHSTYPENQVRWEKSRRQRRIYDD